MSLIEDINVHVISHNRDDSLASILKDVMQKQLMEQPFPGNYYYVTHLINPAQTYFQKMNPEVKKPPELARRLARGKQLHNFAVWFKGLPDFIVDEGIVDGAWVGIPGVRGKIDYRIGDSIIEFKTKDDTPDLVDDVVKYYPQDIEQLAFYSVLHPSNPTTNYLVLMKNTKPYELKAFRMKILDGGTIKSILKSRMGALTDAIKNKNPSRLGRCRYFEDYCEFQIDGACTCDSLKPWNIEPLLRSIQLDFDEQYTHELEEARSEYMTSYTYSVTTRDVISPRKQYMETVLGLESSYHGDEKNEYKACIWTSVNRMKKNYKIGLNKPEKQKVIESHLEPRLRIGFRWLKLQSSIHPHGEILPYLLNVNLSDNPSYTKSPSQYHLAELGIISATYGKNRGLFIRVYPNLNKLVQVFQVTYDKKEQILRMVKSAIDKIEEAKNNNDFLSLPPCKSYMSDGGKCPVMKECHSREDSGCVPQEFLKNK